ncbi:MFS transporter [Bifidobacterium tibiigranuli]|jgi:MFS family permease|uniref:MFS transporter n=1 Tax=Bifidobacterium tibiigranuli TaxID=2172043 RepID=UPI0026EFC0F6|nr:MFS transporter [Bifidobacterium tibiigranuli]MCI1649234.1 MFS transporter [Bifidobacterium tibiigranuli]MCI2185803.1 MFS transporter [Bifidobacterium tibiigranuli]MCI2203114.1 MFS transporter [Bifidobacterium tibiigranuli]
MELTQTSPSLTQPATSRKATSDTVIVAVLAAAGITSSLTQTLVIPLIGQLPTLFHTQSSVSAWAVTVTLLTGAVGMPILGKLADSYGKRRMLLIALVPLIVGSLVCAVAPNIAVLITGRALQGIATGMVPLGISLLHDILPKDKVGTAIALMSSSMGIGGALGLPAAAAVIEYINWRGLFMADFAIALAIAVLIAVLIPTPAEQKSYDIFDFVGAIGLGVALLCLLLAIIDGGSWGWGSPETIGLFAAALIVTLAWGYWELRHTNPLVDLRTTRKHNVLFTNIASIFIGFAMYSQSLLLPQLMQLPTATGYGLGLSMLEMGLCMAPSGLGMMAVSSLGARITKSRGAKTTLICGALVMAAGYACAALLMHSLVALVVASVIGSMGTGLAFGAMPTLIMNGVPANEKASANSFNTVMRSIGTSVSSAVIAMILAGMSVHFGGATIPSQSGFRVGLLIGCFVAVVAAAISLNIRHTRQS